MNSNFKFQIKNYLAWLQSLPEHKKKIILWTIVIILAAAMGFFWVRGAINGLSKLAESTKSIKLPSVSIPDMPSLDILQTTTPSNK